MVPSPSTAPLQPQKTNPLTFLVSLACEEVNTARVGPTFHCHGEGVHGGAVAVGRPALVLAVVLQADAVEVEPAVVVLQPSARFLQAAILLLPLHPRSGSAEEEEKIQVIESEREKEHR